MWAKTCCSSYQIFDFFFKFWSPHSFCITLSKYLTYLHHVSQPFVSARVDLHGQAQISEHGCGSTKSIFVSIWEAFHAVKTAAPFLLQKLKFVFWFPKKISWVTGWHFLSIFLPIYQTSHPCRLYVDIDNFKQKANYMAHSLFAANNSDVTVVIYSSHFSIGLSPNKIGTLGLVFNTGIQHMKQFTHDCQNTFGDMFSCLLHTMIISIRQCQV